MIEGSYYLIVFSGSEGNDALMQKENEYIKQLRFLISGTWSGYGPAESGLISRSLKDTLIRCRKCRIALYQKFKYGYYGFKLTILHTIAKINISKVSGPWCKCPET